MDELDSVRTQVRNGSRDGSPKKSQKEMQEIKHTARETKNAFEGLISRLDTAEERTSELEAISIETCKTEKQREQGPKNIEQNIQGLWYSYKGVS